jgi:hypothetical protein
MSMKCKAGKYLDQREVVMPVIPVNKFGPVRTHCPLLIGCKMDYARRRGDDTCKENEGPSCLPSRS